MMPSLPDRPTDSHGRYPPPWLGLNHGLSLGFNPGVVFARTTVGRAIRDDASAPGRLPSRGWFWHVHQRWGGAQTRQNPAPPAWARTAGGPQGWKPCGRASREQTGGPPAGAGVRVVPRMTAASAGVHGGTGKSIVGRVALRPSTS